MKQVIVGCCVIWALVTGCMTLQERIAKRIEARADYFASLPAERQERLRQGQLQIGDEEDAAWIVYGPPTRTFSRVTAGATNTVWSYVMMESQPIDEFRPVAYPVASGHGRVYWTTDYQFHRSYVFERNEYLRIEFNNKKVSAMDTAGEAQ